MDFEYEALANRVVFGQGVSRTRLATELDALRFDSVILISGRPRPETDSVVTALGRRVRTRFISSRAHVPAEMVDELAAQSSRFPLDAIVSVGGGSTIGAAKALARITQLPIAAVPTTYSGSEVTPIWGVTTDGVKRTGRDPLVLPRIVFYDPDLLVGLPRNLSVASALNAVAHCIDGFWAEGANPVSAALASEALSALRDGLREDLLPNESAERLLYGSFLAGSAFAGTGSGLHHKICHALGGEFDLPHAELHAVMLPIVLEFNRGVAPEAIARIGSALGVSADGVEALHQLTRRVGAPRSLRALGLTDRDRPRAIQAIVSRLPIVNPRIVDATAVEAIIDAAFVEQEPKE